LLDDFLQLTEERDRLTESIAHLDREIAKLSSAF